MKYVIALDLKGHLVELNGSFDTEIEAIKYLHKWYESFKDLKLYIIEYGNGIENDPTYGTPYQFNMSIYYSCEDGVYYEEHYNELDNGLGLKEIGESFLVNNDLLPSEMKEDNELVEKAIESWINSYLNNHKTKPEWLI